MFENMMGGDAYCIQLRVPLTDDLNNSSLILNLITLSFCIYLLFSVEKPILKHLFLYHGYGFRRKLGYLLKWTVRQFFISCNMFSCNVAIYINVPEIKQKKMLSNLSTRISDIGSCHPGDDPGTRNFLKPTSLNWLEK